MRRTAVTGVGVVAPGGVRRARRSGSAITAGRTATRGITFFDPAGFRSQIAAEGDFDPHAAGLTRARGPPHGPLHPVRGRGRHEAIADSGARLSRPSTASASAVTLGIGGGRHHAAGGRLRRGQQPRPATGSWIPTTRCPFLYRALVPSSLASEVARASSAPTARLLVISTGCTSGIDAIGYAPPLIQDGEADIVITGASESPISPISMACFDPIKATSPAQRRPRARLAAVRPRPRRFRHGRGRRRCWCWRRWSAPSPAARTSTARSRASPAAATRTT